MDDLNLGKIILIHRITLLDGAIHYKSEPAYESIDEITNEVEWLKPKHIISIYDRGMVEITPMKFIRCDSVFQVEFEYDLE